MKSLGKMKAPNPHHSVFSHWARMALTDANSACMGLLIVTMATVCSGDTVSSLGAIKVRKEEATCRCVRYPACLSRRRPVCTEENWKAWCLQWETPPRCRADGHSEIKRSVRV